MDVWYEVNRDECQEKAFLPQRAGKGWLGRLVERWGNPSADGRGMGELPEQACWERRLRLLNEECDALRRKMEFSA